MLRHLPHHRQGFSSTLNHHPRPPLLPPLLPPAPSSYCSSVHNYAHASQLSTTTILPFTGSSAPRSFAHMLLNPQPPPSRPPLDPLSLRSSAYMHTCFSTPTTTILPSTGSSAPSFFCAQFLLLVLLRPSCDHSPPLLTLCHPVRLHPMLSSLDTGLTRSSAPINCAHASQPSAITIPPSGLHCFLLPPCSHSFFCAHHAITPLHC